MSRYFKWAGIAIVFYLVCLVIYLPATQVLARIKLPSNLGISGISGTIWQGKAQSLTINGVQLTNVRWRTQFLPLLMGKLTLDVKGGNQRDASTLFISGQIATKFTQSQHFSADDLQLYIPASMLMSKVELPIPVQASGRIKVDIDELDYPAECENLSGSAQWLNATFTGVGVPLNLGTFNVNLSCKDKATLVTVKAPNKLNLTAKATIQADLSIKVSGKFKPDPSLPKTVHDSAQFFGHPDNQGFYLISF